jgi:hypothetical protein
MVRGEGGVDLVQLDRSPVIAIQANQDRPSGVPATSDHEEARALRDERERHQEHHRREELDPEHPAPRLVAPPQQVERGAGSLGEEIVAEKGRRETRDDRHLLDGDQAAPITGFRDLTDVGRRHDARGAHSEAADDAVGHELRRRRRDPRPPRGDDEAHRRRDEQGPAPEGVGEPSRRRGADRAAEQHGSDAEPGSHRIGAERLLQAVDGSVDHPAVEAEQEPADGGDGADEDDEGRVAPVTGRGADHGRSLRHAPMRGQRASTAGTACAAARTPCAPSSRRRPVAEATGPPRS